MCSRAASGYGSSTKKGSGIISKTRDDGADLEASALQPFKALHGAWLPEKLGPDAKGLLPREWRTALLLSASATNTLRDLPPAQKKLLWYEQNTHPRYR